MDIAVIFYFTASGVLVPGTPTVADDIYLVAQSLAAGSGDRITKC